MTNYVFNTNKADLDACTQLMKHLIAMVKKHHPSYRIETKAVMRCMSVNSSSLYDYKVDASPVLQYIVYDGHTKIFDILPLLNAHAYDADGDIWCIEAMYHPEDRDVIYWLADDNFNEALEELEDYIR